MSLLRPDETRGDEVYREELTSFWGWLGAVLFFGITIVFLVMFYIQRTYGPIGANPEPDWFYLLMPAFYLAIAILVMNFTKLTVTANPQGVTAAYGRFRHFEPWENIDGAERDTTSALRSYGGWGIRFGWIRGGKTVLVYNIMGAPLLLLQLKSGKRKYFGFSTRRPEQVVTIVNRWKK